MPICPECEKELATDVSLAYHAWRKHGGQPPGKRKGGWPKLAGGGEKTRFQELPCPHCGETIVEDTDYADLQSFLCLHCRHFIAHLTHDDLGPGLLQGEKELGRATTEEGARRSLLHRQGWRGDIMPSQEVDR